MSYNHENLIVGCGNILFGDDGFGPEVIKYMKEKNISLPGDTLLVDGATSAPHYIFTLPEEKWRNIILVDIADMNKNAGEVAVLDIDEVLESERYMDVHGISATYPLHELKDKVNIKIVACQPENIPQDMEIGLSDTLKMSIPETVTRITSVLLELIE